jgi:CubicO group peptidase (beta-lactamase class C family)
LQSVITHLAGKVDRQHCGTYEAGLEVCASDIADYLAANVLIPLGMDDSSYLWKDGVARDAARPHDETGKPLPLGKPSPIDAARYAAMGGLRTTPFAYAKFLMEILAPHAASRFRLSPASRAEMLRPQIKADESSDWALGWQIRRTSRGNLIQHEGGQTGFLSFAAASLDHKSGYVILTNGANGWKVFFNDRFKPLVENILLG